MRSSARLAVARAALVVAITGVFLALGGALLRERAERATLAPLLAWAAAVAVTPSLRTRRVAAGARTLALVALAGGLFAEWVVSSPRGWHFTAVEVIWLSAFYAGAFAAVAGVYALARAAGPRALAVGLAAVFALLYVPGKIQVHRPKRMLDRDPATAAPGSEAVELVTSDGYRLAATFFPAAPSATAAMPGALLASAGGTASDASRPRRAPVVLVQHGIMADRTAPYPSWARLVHELGYAAFGFDWRGNGRSEGHVQGFGAREVEDVRAAIAYLKTRPDVDATRIAYVGESMGAAIGIVAAAEIPEIRGVCSDAGYDDLRAIATDRMRFWVLPRWMGAAMARTTLGLGALASGVDYDRIAPIVRVPEISPRPVLIVHGDADDATPCECSKRLYAAAREPKELVLIPGGRHGRQPREVLEGTVRTRFAKFLDDAFR